MQGKSSAFCGAATSLEVRYTGKPVSGWGGLVAVMRYLEQRGIRQVLTHALPDGRTSPNQIPVVEVVLALFAAVLTGGRRFAHALSHDPDPLLRRPGAQPERTSLRGARAICVRPVARAGARRGAGFWIPP